MFNTAAQNVPKKFKKKLSSLSYHQFYIIQSGQLKNMNQQSQPYEDTKPFQRKARAEGKIIKSNTNMYCHQKGEYRRCNMLQRITQNRKEHYTS